MVSDIADKDIARRIELEADGLVQLSRCGRSFVSRLAGLACARNGRDHPRLGVHPANHVVAGVGDEEVALVVEADFVGIVQRGVAGWAIVAGVSMFTRADDGGDDPVLADPPNYMPFVLAKPNRAVRPAYDSERSVEFGLKSRSAVPSITGYPGPCEMDQGCGLS